MFSCADLIFSSLLGSFSMPMCVFFLRCQHKGITTFFSIDEFHHCDGGDDMFYSEIHFYTYLLMPCRGCTSASQKFLHKHMKEVPVRLIGRWHECSLPLRPQVWLLISRIKVVIMQNEYYFIGFKRWHLYLCRLLRSRSLTWTTEITQCATWFLLGADLRATSIHNHHV